MFLFEQMFNTALNGIATAGLMSTILTVAYGILLASLLFSAYEAGPRGGDVRALGVAAVKYLALGLLFANGGAVYDSIVRSVLGAFNQIAHTMAGVGPNDVFNAWKNELVAAASSGTFLNVITGGVAGMLERASASDRHDSVPGGVRDFHGPVRAIRNDPLHDRTAGAGPDAESRDRHLARRYAVNFMIFGAWGLIYGIFCRLAVALNINSMAAITGAGNFGGMLAGATAEVLLAAASILFSVCILLIPFLAKRIVEGDLGSARCLRYWALLRLSLSLQWRLPPDPATGLARPRPVRARVRVAAVRAACGMPLSSAHRRGASACECRRPAAATSETAADVSRRRHRHRVVLVRAAVAEWANGGR